ncbi:hypothetical protein RBH39_24480, partial [Escherichia coli]|uniref:hypothetical protein n=1 Tax=Escherichia coli TaxID=562 RepID=UPI003AA0F4FE
MTGQTVAANTAATVSGVSVGAASVKRQIVNVADGQIAAGSTDAMNGGQLWNVTRALNSANDSTASRLAAALGGGAAYNTTDGTWT